MDTLVISALQHEPHHSHATFEESVAFTQEMGIPKTYFTHLSHKMGTHEETEALLPENIRVAFDGLVLEI